MPTKRLARDPNNKWIAGVCGGIARWLDADPDIVRLIYVILSVASAAFPGTLVYLVLWVLMPVEGSAGP
jgi:phage shock protein C